MQNVKLLAGVILGTLVLVFGVAFLFSQESEPELFDAQTVIGEEPHVRMLPAEVGEASDASESAEVSELEPELLVVEFSDFQCPACKQVQPLVEQLMEEYRGRVGLVYRHFPLDQIHPNARRAAVASEIMAEEGKFWEYHDLLFERQEAWAASEDLDSLLAVYAQELGVDREAYMSRLEDESWADKVQADWTAGVSLGVDATPTFFVDGEKINANDLANVLSQKL